MQLSIAKAPSRFEFKSIIPNEISEYFEDRKVADMEAAAEEASVYDVVEFDPFDDFYDDDDQYQFSSYDEAYDPYPYEDLYDDVTYDWD